MRTLLRISGKIAAFSILVPIFYLVSAFTLPFVTSGKCQTNSGDSIQVYVLSNGVHTDLVLPANNTLHNWNAEFSLSEFNVKDSLHNHIAFGWGDKGFYLNTPGWSNLKFSTAFKAAFGIGGTAMHVRYIYKPEEKEDRCVALHISSAQYNDLINYIHESFAHENGHAIKIEHPGYGQHDRFYEAKGKYTLFRTCNMWTNKALKKLGIKVGLWTPFSGGLLSSLQ